MVATLLPSSAAVALRLDERTLVSVVVPCFNEEAVLVRLYDRLSRVAEGWGTDYEVILVDDGSTDATWPAAAALHGRDGRWKAIRLGRNFGHQTALRVGLHA